MCYAVNIFRMPFFCYRVGASGNTPDLSLTFGKGPARGTSAPASPAKSRESLLQRVQSLTGAARDQGASFIGKKRKCFWKSVIL